METEVDEQVSVWAFFDTGQETTRISPIAMNWRRRFIKFEKLVLTTTKKVGGVKILDLICASDGSSYQLEYNTVSSLWRVKKVMGKD